MPNDETKPKTVADKVMIMDRAVEIMTAYLSNPTTRINHNEVADTFRALRNVIAEDFVAETATVAPTENSPAVLIKNSIKPDEIICLECGKGFKSIKRHLGSAHGLSVEQYKLKWSLPEDYPTVAQKYSDARSSLAKASNFGGYASRKAKPPV